MYQFLFVWGSFWPSSSSKILLIKMIIATIFSKLLKLYTSSFAFHILVLNIHLKAFVYYCKVGMSFYFFTYVCVCVHACMFAYMCVCVLWNMYYYFVSLSVKQRRDPGRERSGRDGQLSVHIYRRARNRTGFVPLHRAQAKKSLNLAKCSAMAIMKFLITFFLTQSLSF